MNIIDILVCAVAFGSYVEHAGWNPTADLDNNGIVNILNILIIAVNFGNTW